MISAADDTGTIQLYTDQGDIPANDISKQMCNLQLPPQQLLMNNTQHFTINLSNGQAILTQVNLDDTRGMSGLVILLYINMRYETTSYLYNVKSF